MNLGDVIIDANIDESQHREMLYRCNYWHLRGLSDKAVSTNRKGVSHWLVVIDARDPEWFDVRDALMPGADWSERIFLDALPVARGIVPRSYFDAWLSDKVPALAGLRNHQPTLYHSVLILGDGGATLRDLI